MGFFIGAMASMLGGSALVIDKSLDSTPGSFSMFGRSVRDLISDYHTYLAACTPHHGKSGTAVDVFTTFELPEEGDEWVERFFGMTRRMLILLHRVNKLVARRAQLVQAAETPSTQVQESLLRAEAEQLAADLGASWGWSEFYQEAGKSLRVQRGSHVLRVALKVLVLCELLECPLKDARLREARSTILELVADTAPDETAAFCWPLSIVAVYSHQSADRASLLSAISATRSWSFGEGYRGVDEMLRACWKVYDKTKAYEYGIAPWRQFVHSFGRTLFV